jgi:hypothetical protein
MSAESNLTAVAVVRALLNEDSEGVTFGYKWQGILAAIWQVQVMLVSGSPSTVIRT